MRKRLKVIYGFAVLAACIDSAGCAKTHATVELFHPFEIGSQQSVELDSESAYFGHDAGELVAHLKCEWPLPGSRLGATQYVLYLRLPPSDGVFQIGAEILATGQDGIAKDSNSQSLDSDREVVSGFLIQKSGRLKGVTHLASGHIEIKGGRTRRGTVNLTCADQTEIVGEFVARSGFRMSAFEQDHRIDIANARIVAKGGSIPAPRLADEPKSDGQ